MLARFPVVALVIVLAGIVSRSLQAADPPAEPLPADHAARFARGTEVFKTQVRAVFLQQCVKCHGGENTEAKFDLTSREALLKGSENGPVVVPFSAAKSKLMLFLKHEKEPHMPEGEPKLPAATLTQIESWINDGAPYDAPFQDEKKKTTDWLARKVPAEARQLWAFRPLQAVEPPAAGDAAWSKSPIDRFVLAGLTGKGLKPNPPVDPRRLIRRAYLDLTGLPPTAEEIEAFVDNNSPEAYAKLIDKLLESPHYGERWGRYWLDVSRFAESHGFEQDYDRPFAYHFRDFVIRALNDDLPYNQFVRWQLAGDELAPDNSLALMATGFLGAGVFPTQITANEVERSRYDAIDDMTATMGTAMLGLTIGCARCHDHKYDPIPAADYYRIASTFTTTVRSEIELDLSGGSKEAEEKFQKEHAPLVEALKKFEAEQLPARFAAWEKEKSAATASPWSVVEFSSTKSAGGATLTRQEDGSLLASGTNPDFDTYTFVSKPLAGEIRSLRLEALAHPSFVKGGPGRAGNGNIALTDLRVTALPGGANPTENARLIEVKLIHPRATFEQAPSLLVKYAIDADKKSAWALDPQFGKDHAAIFDLEAPVNLPGGTILTFTLEFQNNNQHNIGRPRISVSSQAGLPAATGDGRPAAIGPILATPADKRTAEQQKTLLTWYQSLDPEWQKLKKAVADHLATKPKSPMTKVMVCSEGLKPIRHHTQGADFFNEFYFLKRGDVNLKQGIAAPGFLQVLSRVEGEQPEKRWQVTPPAGARTSLRRTALANWITDTDAGAGHLLARVIVNRVWHHHFGRGIVGTPNDFGLQGEPPTHPELLDWLAHDFITRGQWKLKYLHRQLMTSQAYLQASTFDAEKSKVDPQNRLLWRYAPRRLEAEAIRDSMLSVSGSLDRTMFGPGTLDEGQLRRSIYFMIKRSRLISMMQIFDQPEPLVSVGSRPSTTIAPQALAFMNSPHVRKYAHQFAGRLLPLAGKSPEEAIRRGYLDAVGRPPTAEELADNVAFLKKQTESYTAAKKPQPTELALTDFCQVLFCLNDFVYVE